MNIAPQAHFHETFQFADNTDSKGCCCWWRSNTVPREYTVTDQYKLQGHNQSRPYRERILANQRLGWLIKSQFDNDPIANDEAFEKVKKRINDNLSNGDPITSEKLARIINAIHSIKEEMKDAAQKG